MGLGIGDHTVTCSVDTPGQVTVYNPNDGSKVAQAFPPDPNTNTCLGGSSETINPAGATQPSIPSTWSVWLQDGVGTALGNHNLYPVAAFGLMEVETTQEAPASSRTCEPSSTYSQACVEEPGDVTKRKQVARFAVCGAGETTGIDTATFNEQSKASDDDYTLTKTVLVDGPIFYYFDCVSGTCTRRWSPRSTRSPATI